MFETKNTKRYLLVFFLVISLVFSPINFSFFVHISPAQADDLNIEEDTVWSGLQAISGYITVDSNTTLRIKAGSIIEFDGWSGLDILGSLRVEGTPDNPVVFRKKNNNTKEYYTITSSGGKIYARNIDVSGGGNASEVSMSERNRSPFQYANAMWIYRGAFSVYDGGTLDIEGANFHDNGLAVYAEEYLTDETKIWRSKFSHNKVDFVNSFQSNILDVRYNWWGDKDGPEKHVPKPEEYYPPKYERITGDINVSDWAKIADFRDPVVVIPGILGSWKKNNQSDLELDPLRGTYNNLLETLDKNGYTLEKDLFPFPYEWHYSNVESAKLLRTKINEIKAIAKWPKVDIVAHSMGGLVAREYIGTLDGGGNIDQFITLGTPHNGSSESYLIWDGGDFYDSSFIRKYFTKKIFQQEAEENGYETVFDYVRKAPIPSVRELLPVYDYLRDKGSDTLRTYSDLYPKNTFLENLKKAQNIARLDALDFTNIVGKTSGNDTISTIRVGGSSIELLNDPEKIVLWGHGKPDGYDSLFGDKGLELGIGDGTVPLTSAEGVDSDETIELDSSHGDLPTNSAKTVVKKLTGVDAIAYSATPLPTSYILFMPFSPIDIQIISPKGLRVGKNFETNGIYDEIPGAYYTGFDTQNEFITIPNPEKGTYRILTRGTGSGSYRLEVSSVQEDASGDGVESMKTITGTAELNKAEENIVNVTETDGVLTVNDQNTDDTSDDTTTDQGSNDSTDNTTTESGSGGKSHKNSTKKKNTAVTTAVSYPFAQKFGIDRSNPLENTPIQILASVIPSGENFRTKNVAVATSESENIPLSKKVKYILSPLDHVFFLFW